MPPSPITLRRGHLVEKTNSGLPMILHYGELCNCFIISQGRNNRKFTINVMHLNHLTPPHPSQWKNCPPKNQYLVTERLGTTGLIIIPPDFCFPILTKPWARKRCYRSHYIILICCPSLLGKGKTSDQAWLIRSSPGFLYQKWWVMALSVLVVELL